jgi:hypothetical protein
LSKLFSVKNRSAAVATSPRAKKRLSLSVLTLPAWLRVLATLPVIALLWLAVAWAQLESAPW